MLNKNNKKDKKLRDYGKKKKKTHKWKKYLYSSAFSCAYVKIKDNLVYICLGNLLVSCRNNLGAALTNSVVKLSTNQQVCLI